MSVCPHADRLRSCSSSACRSRGRACSCACSSGSTSSPPAAVEGKEYWGDEPPFSPPRFRPAASTSATAVNAATSWARPRPRRRWSNTCARSFPRANGARSRSRTPTTPCACRGCGPPSRRPTSWASCAARSPTSSTHGSVWDSSGPRSTQSRKQVNAGAARIEWASGAQTPARATIAWRPSPSSGSPWANRRSPKSSSSRRSNASRSPALTSSGSSPSSPSETNRGISS